MIPAPDIGPTLFSFPAADPDALRGILGDRLHNAVLNFSSTASPLGTGGCVRTLVPSGAFQDMILELDIGLNDGLASELFPDAYPSVFSSAADAAIALSPASCSGLCSIRSAVLLEHIYSSQLRQWEQKGRLAEYTACVCLKLRPKDPKHGTLVIRLAYTWHSWISKLYPGPNS